MGRPKKVVSAEIVQETVTTAPIAKVIPTKLSIDYHSEHLNNMARTINEIIDYLHG